ncbi:amidohydrolase family protein [Microcella sp.]|uniref:amidohydrolase family protein n=1 Tax=Microcella sp. TaxID=1913979 RepID=UPI002562A6BB|nr:amidohydrolase family protein [Microcella sp.]MBX9471685.1 amidohydrolase family protein [Microcella sp.]
MTVERSIIDVHTHVGRTITSGIGQSVAESIALMSSTGIAQAILSVAAGGLQSEGVTDTRRANDEIAATVVAHPDLFPVGLASVEVRHGPVAVAEVHRAFDELGLKGLAFHATFEGFTVVSPAFASLLDAVGERRGLILVHSTPDAKASPSAIAAVAARYPTLTFIMGHPVFSDDQKKQAVEAVLATPNVLVDIAYQADPATTEFFVREVGAARVVFGSDAPFFDPAEVIRSVEQARITDAERDAILAGNARSIINSL